MQAYQTRNSKFSHVILINYTVCSKDTKNNNNKSIESSNWLEKRGILSLSLYVHVHNVRSVREKLCGVDFLLASFTWVAGIKLRPLGL